MRASLGWFIGSREHTHCARWLWWWKWKKNGGENGYNAINSLWKSSFYRRQWSDDSSVPSSFWLLPLFDSFYLILNCFFFFGKNFRLCLTLLTLFFLENLGLGETFFLGLWNFKTFLPLLFQVFVIIIRQKKETLVLNKKVFCARYRYRKSFGVAAARDRGRNRGVCRLYVYTKFLKTYVWNKFLMREYMCVLLAPFLFLFSFFLFLFFPVLLIIWILHVSL